MKRISCKCGIGKASGLYEFVCGVSTRQIARTVGRSFQRDKRKGAHELASCLVGSDICAALLGLVSMALDFADKLARESHGLYLLPDYTRQVEQRKSVESLTATANDQTRWVDMMSAWNKVLALVLILNLTMLKMPIDLARIAADFVVANHTRRVSQATDILAHLELHFWNTDAFLVAAFQEMTRMLEHKRHSLRVV